MKKLRKLSNYLYVYDFDQYSDRPNLYYIKGKDYSVAVDAGNSPAHCKEFYDAIQLEGFPLPKYTIISHWHWDHTFGLSQIAGQSISSELTHTYLDKVGQWKWTKKDMEERLKTGEEIEFCHENIQREYPDLSKIKVVNTDLFIKEKKILNLGDIEIILIPRPSTHSLDSVFVYLPFDDALIVQDVDCEDFYHGAVYFQDRLRDLIGFLESINYRKHYLGHADVESKQQALNRLKGELK